MNDEILDRLFHWLEDDRDRRSLVIRASNLEIWWAALRIDDRSISATDGNDLGEVLTEILEGMVIATPDGSPAPEGDPGTDPPGE